MNLKLATSLIFGSLCISAQAKKDDQKDKRPNILWLTFEDTSPEFIGCYGNEMAQTPTIDSLAKEGVLFTNAFSTGTVSSASRFCLITGCKPGKYGTGNHRSAYEIPDFICGFPQSLKQDGYYTSNNAKTDYNHMNHHEMTAKSWHESSSKATWRNREAGQPFFAVFNSNHSHQSRKMTNPWDIYENQVLSKLNSENSVSISDNFMIPPFFRNSPQMRKNVSRIYNSIALTDQDFKEILQNLEDDGLRDSTIIFCFSDHGEGMPRAKGSALNSGYRVPFVLWIPEAYKHLSPWKSGEVSDELISFEDLSATVLSLAGVKIPSYNEGVAFLPKQNTKNRDKKKKYVFGACDAVDNNIETSRSITDGRYLYTRVFTCFQPFVRWIGYYDHSDIQKQMRKDYADGLLNDHQKKILQPRKAEYLYDTKNDRWELTNLINSTRHQPILRKMRKELFNHLKESRDINFMPEYILSSYHKKIMPYDLRSNSDIYPFNEVLKTASLCGMGSSVIDKQLEKLQSENQVVSYWAAIGLFSQRENLKNDIDRLESLLPTIEFPLSKIWMAAAILNIKESHDASKIICESLAGNNKYIVINTINALLEMEINRAKSFIPAINDINTDNKDISIEGVFDVAKQRLEGKEFRYSTFW